VVRTRRDQVHSIDGDAVAVVGQAADNRQAGDPAGALQLDTRDVAQQARRVAGRRPQGTQCFFLHLTRRWNGLQAVSSTITGSSCVGCSLPAAATPSAAAAGTMPLAPSTAIAAAI
jgi:hypothetical protein